MAAAAATSRQRVQRQKSILRARNSCRRKAEQRVAVASKVFDSLANSQGRLADDQLETFLETALKIPKGKLHPDAARLVRDTARANRRNSNNLHADNDEVATDCTNTSFNKPAMMDAIQKYGLYLRKRDEIKALFDEFDIDNDGLLSHKELQSALQERERTANRSVCGIRTELIVSQEDVEFILRQADTEGDGMIDRAEVLPALAAWEELAESRLEEMEREGVCSCVLL